MNEIEVFCSGELRRLPSAVWDALEGPKPHVPALYINNGCTLSPDRIFGKETWPACVVHDFQYNGAGLDRRDADEKFRRNLVVCLKADGMLAPLAHVVAFFYHRVVRRAGRPFYSGPGDPR